VLSKQPLPFQLYIAEKEKRKNKSQDNYKEEGLPAPAGSITIQAMKPSFT